MTDLRTAALRLADALIEDASDHLEVSHAWDMRPEVTINHRHYMNAIQAVVELRRLHAESQGLKDALFQTQEAAKSLLAQRDALLEALKAAEPYLRHADVAYNVYVQARAVINAVENV